MDGPTLAAFAITIGILIIIVFVSLPPGAIGNGPFGLQKTGTTFRIQAGAFEVVDSDGDWVKVVLVPDRGAERRRPRDSRRPIYLHLPSVGPIRDIKFP